MESEEDKISPENKKRRLKTPFQVEGLEAFYAEHKYPSEAMKNQLSVQLGLSEKQVQGWFCHRRLKDKRHMKEEVINNGKQESRNGSIQDSANGVKQDSANGVKQDSGSSGKKVDHQSYLTSKDAGHQPVNAMNYPAAVLASELRDQDLFTVTHDNMEDTFGGSNSASQERSSLHSGNPNEVEAIRYMSQNGNCHEMEAKRKKKMDFYMDPCLLDNGEHEAIVSVKKQLGKEYREDGPPLGVEFQSLPPGSFDAPIEPCYQGNSNVNDLPRLSNAVKTHDVGKVNNGSHRFNATCGAGPRQGYSGSPAGLKFEQASPNFERASPSFEWTRSKSGLLNGKSTRRSVNSHLQAGDNYHVPDLNSSMQMDEDSPDESLSSGFATKSFPSWHKQEKPGRARSETYMPLFYGTKNGTIPGNNGTIGKELPISRPYNGIDPYYNVSAMNTNFNAASFMQCGDRLSSQGEVKPQLKKMTKKERLQEEKRIKREHGQALKLKQKLLKKEGKRVEREKQREDAKCQADADKVLMLMNQAKGHAGEIPTSVSDENAANSTSSME